MTRIMELLVRAAVALVVYGSARQLLVRVHGPSMEPTLHPGDVLLTVPACRSRLRRGMVVVLRDPADPDHLVIKRVTRVRGDVVEVLGDNPRWSTDSRQWGGVRRAAVTRIALCMVPDVRRQIHRTIGSNTRAR